MNSNFSMEKFSSMTGPRSTLWDSTHQANSKCVAAVSGRLQQPQPVEAYWNLCTRSKFAIYFTGTLELENQKHRVVPTASLYTSMELCRH